MRSTIIKQPRNSPRPPSTGVVAGFCVFYNPKDLIWSRLLIKLGIAKNRPMIGNMTASTVITKAQKMYFLVFSTEM